jgi:hypothetical protein
MSKKSRTEKRRGKSLAPAAKRRRPRPLLTLLLAAAIIAAVALVLLRGRQTLAQPAAPPATMESAAAPGVKAGFERLRGRWQRPDGGYVLEIRNIDGKGKMDAGYYNPRPINVSRAEASQAGATAKLFIELRGKNYPGSTYTLAYDPGSDQLRGSYFQAALQQSFDVIFVRMK